MLDRLALLLRLLLAFYTALASAGAAQEPLVQQAYKVGQPIPVSCLNRTIDTGEHITDDKGQLEYIPFPTCNETGRPLELLFGVEKEINCTLDFIDDTFFHLLEFYVHNDAPLTCRIPTIPLPPSALPKEYEEGTTDHTDGQGSLSEVYTPMVVALTGTLQLSHLHVSTSMNVLVHAAPKSVAPGTIAAATAYSISRDPPTRIVIGDSLPLRFSVRWYPNTSLPSGWTGVGGHLTFSTLVYCVISALASAAICVAYFRGVELPRRLKSHGKDRLGMSGMERGGLGGYGLSSGGMGMNGYGYGLGPIIDIDYANLSATVKEITGGEAASPTAIGPRDHTTPKDPPSTSTNIPQAKPKPKIKLNNLMDTAHLPKGMVLDHVNFFPWEAKIDTALRALGLPTSGDVKPLNTSMDEWQAVSKLAAKIIHGFVSGDVFKSVSTRGYHDHARLVKELKNLKLTFPCLKLPEEVQNRMCSLLNYTTRCPLRDRVGGSVAIGRLSKEIREKRKAVPTGYQYHLFLINFAASKDLSLTDRIRAKRGVYVPAYAYRIARFLDDKLKDDFRDVAVTVRMQCEASERGALFTFGFEYIQGKGISMCDSYQKGNFLTTGSKRLLNKFAAKVEADWKALGVGGRSLIMALMRDEPIWKYGTLRCKIGYDAEEEGRQKENRRDDFGLRWARRGKAGTKLGRHRLQ